MEQALRLSRNPAERAQAALGVSHGALPGRRAAGGGGRLRGGCSRADGELDRELRLALEFQAAATRLVGGLPDVETFGRLLALEPEVSAVRRRPSAACSP